MKTEHRNSLDNLAELADHIIKLSRIHGADQAQVSLSQSKGLDVQMHQGRVLARTREAQSGFSLTVFMGKRLGSVNSSDLSPGALEESVKAACVIARHTGEDPAVGLASAELLCRNPQDLDLLHPRDLDESQAVILAQRMEKGLTDVATAVQSEGAWVSSSQSYYVLATSEGFNQGIAQSSHSLGVSALARDPHFSELDFWSQTAVDPTLLASPESIGELAGKRAVAYLSQLPLGSRRCPVLFDAPSAVSLMHHIAQAISSRALYTNSSFLRHQLDRPIMSEHLSLHEDPFILRGNASVAFDGDGIAPQRRELVDRGMLRGFLLSLYGARRLHMQPTGNGFGPTNLRLQSCLTLPGDDLESMLRKLGTGLLVTSLAGDGVRLISGDYSRGARGFWVENGLIQHAVTGITISGNLDQMLRGILAVGDDLITQGPFTTGSVLIQQMQISGH